MPALKQYIAAILLAILTPTAFCETSPTNQNQPNRIIDQGIHPGKIADAIIILIPDRDIPLDKIAFERPIITGEIISNERKQLNGATIRQPKNTFIAPIKKGKSVKIFLKQYQDSNEFYAFGIYPDWFPSDAKQ